MRTLVLSFLFLVSIGCTRQIDTAQSTFDSVGCFDSERYGLKSFSSEADLKQIRIWYSHAFLDRIPVVSLKQSKTGEWSGELFLIIWNFDKTPPVAQEIRRKKLIPKTNWDSLIGRLEGLQIFSLPDMDKIEGFEGMLDGSSYTIQIEKNDTCRNYAYSSPDYFQNEFWQAKSMVQILDEVKDELGVPWTMRDSIGVKEFWMMVNDTTLKTKL